MNHTLCVARADTQTDDTTMLLSAAAGVKVSSARVPKGFIGRCSSVFKVMSHRAEAIDCCGLLAYRIVVQYRSRDTSQRDGRVATPLVMTCLSHSRQRSTWQMGPMPALFIWFGEDGKMAGVYLLTYDGSIYWATIRLIAVSHGQLPGGRRVSGNWQVSTLTYHFGTENWETEVESYRQGG